MSEITCSECGALNPTQSKFCNRCGASFVSDTTHICPSCDTPNPINLLYCDACGTRLVDDSASAQGPDDDADPGGERTSRSQAFSLPTRPPGQTGSLDVSAELPDWLKTGDFSGDHEENDSEDDDLQWLRAAQEGEVWADEEAPTLEELSSDHAPRDDLPTWLMDEDSAGEIFSGGKSTDELFMSSSAVDPGDAKEPSGAPQPTDDREAASDLQSWLSEMEADDPAQTEPNSDAGASPVASEVDEPLATPSSASPEMEEDDFLQWLSEIKEDSATDDGEPDSTGDDPLAPSDLPSWLDSREEPSGPESEGSSGEESDGTDAPEWITNLADESVIQSGGGASAGAEAEAEVEGPAWLVGTPMNDGEDESGDPADTATESTDDKQEDDFLQWLDSLDTSKGATGRAHQSDEAVDAVESTALGAQPPGSEFTEADFALPEWLGDLAEPANLETQDDSVERAELPAWLQEITPPGDNVTLPYVSGTELETNEALQEEDASGEFDKAAETRQSEAAPEPTETELPDWITGVSAELDSAGDRPEEKDQPIESQSPWAQADSEKGQPDSTSIDLDDQQVANEDLPDWFSDVLADIKTADESQTSPFGASELANVPEQLAGAELPDWLDSPFVDEAAAEPTPLEEIPEWLRAPLKEKLARAAIERGVEETTLDSGDEWRELLEAPVSAEESTKSQAHNPVPVWLESLRSSALSASDDDEVVGASESGSPIAALPGAIGIAPVVTQGTRRKHTVPGGTSKEQEQQILLLRQLARSETGERSVVLPTASATGPLSVLARLLLAALLLITIVLGLAASSFWPNLVPSADGNSSIPLMQSVVVDAAGQPVLLVFDYTPAMAGALDPLAEDLLQRLEDQDSLALLTSQSASGLTLASRAVSRSGVLTANDLGFIPGGALGVRRLGHCITTGAFCHSLFGQVIDDETAGQLGATSAVVVITADRDSLLAWIEQLDAIDSISLSAIVTPGLQPVAGPYLASGQLAEVAVANGLLGANQTSGAVTALGLSQLFIAAAMIAGAIFYLLQGVVRRRRM